jgi:hypothetical protein
MPPSELDKEQSSWNTLAITYVVLVLEISMPKGRDSNSTIPYNHGMMLKTAATAATLPLPYHFAFTLPLPYHFTF